MKFIDPHSAEDSLRLPIGDSRIYNIENWKIEEVKPDIPNTFKFQMKLKISEYDIVRHWDITDKDIEKYGEGNLEKMKLYLSGSFEKTLLALKNNYLQQLKNAGGLF